MVMTTGKKSTIHLKVAEIGRKWVIIRAYQEFDLENGEKIYYANKKIYDKIDENFGNRYKFAI
ncbi:MAG: hypothetical protein J6W17_04095 [Campylobacter sp.]|nr:hypothetical protein [Campylobacter sp.]